MLEVQEALARLLDTASPLAPVLIPVDDALGLTLAERVVADRDSPPTDRSAMDGFAVRSGDFVSAARSVRITGEVRAGQDASAVVVGVGEAVRIFTGAVLPRGADAVVMVELTEEDRSAGTVVVRECPTPGQHVRPQGEDLKAGETVLEAGSVVRPAEFAALAAVGRTRVAVVRPPHVSVISTGDEIVDVASAPLPHQVRNSNAKMLSAQVRAMRLEARDLGIMEDDRATLLAAIEAGLSSDVLLLTGGVSVGDYDFVGDALQRAGCEILFHNVAMRPGKPILAARRRACLVVGLPGNPVSAFTGFHVFVAPALRKLMGNPCPVVAPIRATLIDRLSLRPGVVTYHLAHVTRRNGEPVVAPVTSTGSGDVLALARANAFIVAAGDARPIPAGTEVDVQLWDWGQSLLRFTR